MAIVKKFNSNQIYFSKKLEEKLSEIYNYTVTIAEAPTGYGKTTAIKEYLKASGKQYIWFNIDSVNKEKTFYDFCAKIKNINENAAHKLMSGGYPYDDDSCNKMVDAINGIKYLEPTVFVIDNYHLVADKYLNQVVKDLSGSAGKNTRIVILTQAINSTDAFELILNRKINYLSKTDFELSREELVQYYKMCGVKLEEDEADFLYKYTEGWISALYLQMLSYVATNSFELTVDIENLLGKAIWYNLDRASQDFLIGMSVFNSFTLRQCIYIANGAILEKQIEELLNNSGFIRYDAREGKYFMHSILRYFLESHFEKMEVVFRKRILKNAGDWYRDNEDYAAAIEFYYKIKDYEAVLSMDYGMDVLNEIHLQYENKNIFIEITSNLSRELKKKYIKTYILFVYFLYLDNEREYYQRECGNIKEIIEQNYKNSDEYSELIGEFYVLKCLGSFNHIVEMRENLEKAFELTRKPSRVLNASTPFLFCCPSPMMIYHSKTGKLSDETDELDSFMPVYYQITDGKSKGMSALFRAEMLLNRGELTDAMKLCDKTIYMSATRELVDVHISALLCICRIAYLCGDYEKMKKSVDEMCSLVDDTTHYDLILLCDLCVGFISVSINSGERLAAWLTDAGMIEKNTIIFGLGYANVIYGRYLLIQGEYEKFLGISGQMLGVAGIYNNILCKIYIIIYMAVAKNRTGKRNTAKAMLLEAIELAEPDCIYLPFVECHNILGSLITEVKVSANNAEFIRKINEMAKKYVKGLQSVEKVTGDDKRYGLTKREMEVAKLAAQRLSNKEIAEQLFIAESTVKSNLKVIFNKLGINSRNELKNFL